MRVMRVASEAPVCLHQSILVPLILEMRWELLWWCGNFRWAGIQLCAGDGGDVAGLALLLVFMSARKQPEAVALPTANYTKTQKDNLLRYSAGNVRFILPDAVLTLHPSWQVSEVHQAMLHLPSVIMQRDFRYEFPVHQRPEVLQIARTCLR